MPISPPPEHQPSQDIARPERQLDVRHGLALCVGMVVGAGIFKTSPAVAAALGSDAALLWAWGLGGLQSLVGALCFAELAAAFPDAGGDYHFLRRAYGARLGLLFAWSRFAVIHTGSMALLAFVFGDYLLQLVDLGPWLGAQASAVLAAGLILLLTLLNLLGVRVGLGTQLGLMVVVIGGMLLLGLAAAGQVLAGVPPLLPPALPDLLPDLVPAVSSAVAEPPVLAARQDWGLALVFVFLAYGGWSDAATVSAEMRDARRGISRVLIGGLLLVTALYLLANWAYLRVLGLDGLARSSAPAAELMRICFGRPGELLMVAVVSLTALSVMNAILIAGPRTTYAAARDLRSALPLARWHARRGTPLMAMLATSAVALLLVGFAALTRDGFATMVDYLSPVYWFFMCLSAVALIVLRRREPMVPRPFRVPLYPLLPLLFAAFSAYLLWSSLVYVKAGALLGFAVLGLGALLFLLLPRPRPDGGGPD